MKAQPHTRGAAPRRKPLGRDRRRWRRLASRAGPEALLAALPSFPRPLLERTAQVIIDQLDQWDGDCEAEDDDPSGGAVEDEAEAVDHYAMKPVYGVDQSKGPINEIEIMRAHREAMFAESDRKR